MTNIPSRLIETDRCESESMIFEVAVIEVKPGFEEQFESGVAEALPVFNRAKGYKSLLLERSIETPHRYRLVIGWETLDDHVSGFRSSPDFQLWRSLVGHTFAVPPAVDHTTVVLTG